MAVVGSCCEARFTMPAWKSSSIFIGVSRLPGYYIQNVVMLLFVVCIGFVGICYGRAGPRCSCWQCTDLAPDGHCLQIHFGQLASQGMSQTLFAVSLAKLTTGAIQHHIGPLHHLLHVLARSCGNIVNCSKLFTYDMKVASAINLALAGFGLTACCCGLIVFSVKGYQCVHKSTLKNPLHVVPGKNWYSYKFANPVFLNRASSKY